MHWEGNSEKPFLSSLKRDHVRGPLTSSGQRRQKEKGKRFKIKKSTGMSERIEIQSILELYKTFNFSAWEIFKDAPLSVKTKAGLEKCGFLKPTQIQKATLGPALQGRDILGAAKTGSGKTLAFIIPVLELLFREMWTRLDGLGAIIITPTRELAYQIFEVLKKVGARHDLSAGLIIGGTEVRFEENRLHGTNIIICTPGRLLQHMDQNPLLDATNLKLLVLDEADRILDMGFERDLNAILLNLPAHRQTMLFSATQTKSVKDLARLSLRNPCYVSVHEQAYMATPDQLHQEYLVCQLHDKLSLLWSFLKNHKGKKVIVFFSCCKQVQFINTIMRRLRPGTTVMLLHGNMSQPRRMLIYEEFCSKRSAILIATDLAARGLDFPKVDWVLQMDCPEDADTYIHRVGRTARFENTGKALLVLLPTEEKAILEQLRARKIPLEKIAINPRRFYDIQRKVEAMCTRDAELKAAAQRCFVGYLKYVFMQKNKCVFRIEMLDLDLYARSLGLVVTPRVRFLNKFLSSKAMRLNEVKDRDLRGDDTDASTEHKGTRDEAANAYLKKPQLSKKIEKFSFDTGIDSDEEILTRKGKPLLENEDISSNVFATDATDAANINGQISDKNVFCTMDCVKTANEANKEKKSLKTITKIQLAKKVLKKKHITANKKMVFDDEGRPYREPMTILSQPLDDVEERGGIDIKVSQQLMRQQDVIDKKVYREKIKARHRDERLRARAERRAAITGANASLATEIQSSSDNSDNEWNERNNHHSNDVDLYRRNAEETVVLRGVRKKGLKEQKSQHGSLSPSETHATDSWESEENGSDNTDRNKLGISNPLLKSNKRPKLDKGFKHDDCRALHKRNACIDIRNDELLALQLLQH